VRLRSHEDDLVAALRAIQELVLRHPVAVRSALAALIAEGRRFAETPEGRTLGRRLAGSPLVREARLVFKMASLFSLDAQPSSEPLPSSYLDGLFLAASSGDPDRLLDLLFGVESGDATHR
jgi:hypothetical protein